MRSLVTSLVLMALLGAALVVPSPIVGAQEDAKKAEEQAAAAGADRGFGQIGPMT